MRLPVTVRGSRNIGKPLLNRFDSGVRAAAHRVGAKENRKEHEPSEHRRAAMRLAGRGVKCGREFRAMANQGIAYQEDIHDDEGDENW